MENFVCSSSWFRFFLLLLFFQIWCYYLTALCVCVYVWYFKVARRWDAYDHIASSTYWISVQVLFVDFGCSSSFFPSLHTIICILIFFFALSGLLTHSFRKFRQDFSIFTRKKERVEYPIFISSHFLSSFHRYAMCCECAVHTHTQSLSDFILWFAFVFKAFSIIF